jgi:hypothetical protein
MVICTCALCRCFVLEGAEILSEMMQALGALRYVVLGVMRPEGSVVRGGLLQDVFPAPLLPSGAPRGLERRSRGGGEEGGISNSISSHSRGLVPGRCLPSVAAFCIL